MREQRYFLIPGIQLELGMIPIVSYAPTGTPVRALVMIGGYLRQIPDNMLGTSLKPVVLFQGDLKQRATSEGLAVVLDQGKLRTLASDETLMI